MKALFNKAKKAPPGETAPAAAGSPAMADVVTTAAAADKAEDAPAAAETAAAEEGEHSGDEGDDGDDGPTSEAPSLDGVVLVEGIIERRDIAGAKVSSWIDGYFALLDSGLVVQYKSAKKAKAKEVWRFPDGCFYRRTEEEEAEEHKKPKERLLMMVYEAAPVKRKGLGEFVKRVSVVMPVTTKKKATEADQAAFVDDWVLQLSKVGIVAGETPTALGATKAGAYIGPDPAFKKGNFAVPVRFEWYGLEDEIRERFGLPSGELEYRLEYKRRALVNKGEADGKWIRIDATRLPAASAPRPATATGIDSDSGIEIPPVVTVYAETVIPATRGYQSRWKARAKRTGAELPNCIRVHVLSARDLRPANKKKGTSNAYVEGAWLSNRATAKGAAETVAPTFGSVWTLPIGTDSTKPAAETQALIDAALTKPLSLMVKSFASPLNKFLGYAEAPAGSLVGEGSTWLKLGPKPLKKKTPAADAAAAAAAAPGAGAAADADPTENAEPEVLDESEAVDASVPLGEIEVRVEVVYDDEFDFSWVKMLTPLRKSPNLVVWFKDKIPLVGLMAKKLPRERWDVRTLPVGDSAPKARVREALISLEEWLPANTWDLKAAIEPLEGGFANGRYFSSAIEKGMRAANEHARNPANLYKLRAKALSVPIMALKALLKVVKVNLDALIPNPMAILIPEDNEPKLLELRAACLQHGDKRIAKGLDVEFESNRLYPEEEFGIATTLPKYEAVRDAILSKRPRINEAFRLPSLIQYVPKKKEDPPASVQFYYATAMILSPVHDNPKLVQSAQIKNLKSKVPFVRRKTVVAADQEETAAAATAEAGAAEGEAAAAGPAEGGAEAAEAEEGPSEFDLPEPLVPLERIAEVALLCPLVARIRLHRSAGDLPRVVAIVQPNEGALMAWAASAGVAGDLAALCASTHVRYVVLKAMQDASAQVLVDPIKAYDFVRMVSLSAADPGEGHNEAAWVEANKAVLDSMLEEATQEIACLSQEWIVADLARPSEGVAWLANVYLAAGPYAYKWCINGVMCYDQGFPIPAEGGRQPAPADKTEFKIVHVAAFSPFGVGVETGW